MKGANALSSRVHSNREYFDSVVGLKVREIVTPLLCAAFGGWIFYT